MGIIERIETDTTAAQKAKDVPRVSVLRLVRAAIKNAEIEQRTRGAIDPEQLAISVIKRQIKQTQDAMEDFRRGNRNDLLQSSEFEVALLQTYLPAELSDEELDKIINSVLPLGAPIQNMGKAIGDVMKIVAGRADGARVRAKVEARTKG